MYTSHFGHAAVVNLLLEAGADVNAQCEVRAPLANVGRSRLT
jgi:ankyrin repeat protein